jgi:hypothetical protein
MHRLALTSLALATATLATFAVDLGTAEASPEDRGSVRDHRSAPVDHGPRRYRRRPGPRLMMPLKIDLGMTGANTSMGYMPGVELRAGIHWASLSPQPTNFDIGLGLFGAVLPGADNDAMPEQDNDVLYGGGYLEAGQTLSKGNWWRTWGSGRVEYLGVSAFGQEQQGFGVAGRLSAELYASGVGIEPRGLFLGTYAVGVYAEAAGRGLGEDVSALQVSAGLTFRTPLVFAP